MPIILRLLLYLLAETIHYLEEIFTTISPRELDMLPGLRIFRVTHFLAFRMDLSDSHELSSESSSEPSLFFGGEEVPLSQLSSKSSSAVSISLGDDEGPSSTSAFLSRLSGTSCISSGGIAIPAASRQCRSGYISAELGNGGQEAEMGGFDCRIHWIVYILRSI